MMLSLTIAANLTPCRNQSNHCCNLYPANNGKQSSGTICIVYMYLHGDVIILYKATALFSTVEFVTI